MRVRTLMLTFMLVAILTPTVSAAQNVLTWTDNSGDEQGFKLERVVVPTLAACVPAAVGFAALATVGVGVVTYTDLGVTAGVTYCYRVYAYNPAGPSAFSNVAGRTVPFTVPAPPSGLTVN